ncbi:hypothetical protein N665_1375s0001 [Sinapis alba]|nr:hypothetical protein N665_1375s0001 [Sinapis alba]
MIDTGSSINVLFYDAFKRMSFTKVILKKELTPLIGFTDETTYIAGGVQKIVEFIVIDRYVFFNAILGRPWHYNMMAVPSTYHQCLKLLTQKRIETIRGSKSSSRTLYLANFKDIEPSST